MWRSSSFEIVGSLGRNGTAYLVRPGIWTYQLRSNKHINPGSQEDDTFTFDVIGASLKTCYEGLIRYNYVPKIPPFGGGGEGGWGVLDRKFK